MMSNNASTYLMSYMNSTSLKQALEHHGVTWQFIPKRATWKVDKQALLGRSFVTLPILETIVVEVEATLND